MLTLLFCLLFSDKWPFSDPSFFPGTHAKANIFLCIWIFWNWPNTHFYCKLVSVDLTIWLIAKILKFVLRFPDNLCIHDIFDHSDSIHFYTEIKAMISSVTCKVLSKSAMFWILYFAYKHEIFLRFHLQNKYKTNALFIWHSKHQHNL